MISEHFINIGDQKVTSVRITETAEPLVDLRSCGFRVDQSRSQIASRSEFFSWVRTSVADRLKLAAQQLPSAVEEESI